MFLFIYIIVMKYLPVPTYSYFNANPHINETLTIYCNGTRGDLSEKCNAARQVDLWIMGWDHMYTTPEYTRSAECQFNVTYSDCPRPLPPGNDSAQAWCFVPMDPEGILSSLPTVLTTFIGFHFGNVLIHYKVDHYIWQLIDLMTLFSKNTKFINDIPQTHTFAFLEWA